MTTRAETDVTCGPGRATPAVLVLPVPVAGAASPGLDDQLQSSSGLTAPRARRLTAAGGGWARVPVPGSPTADVLLVDVGPEADDDPLGWLGVVAEQIGARTREDAEIATTVTTLCADPAAAAAVLVDHLLVGRRRYDRYRSGARAPARARLEVWDPRLTAAELASAAAQAATVAAAVGLARDLVDTPAMDATPAAVAEQVADAARTADLPVDLLVGDELVRHGLHGLVAVGAASAAPPVAVRIRPRTTDRRHVALVGKGVTFDSGGLDLKTQAQMATMKQDMAGAAAVAAATVAAADLGDCVPVDAWLLFCENMPGGAALRPGDVVRHADGTTSEVVSPDAEGRLLLADALHLAATGGADAVVDVATLTGGGGLGPDLWAVVGSSDSLVQELLAAGAAVGDPGWPLPHRPQYCRFLRSPLADRRHLPGPSRYPFPTVAVGAYLGQFVGDVPWAHLDVSAVTSTDDPVDPPGPRATGRPTRALLRWLHDRGRGR